MRQQYHFRSSENGLLAWNVFRLIELARDLPVIDVLLSEIAELNEAFWYELRGAQPTCNNIIEHVKLIQKADLSYPIILCHDGRVMDGMPRVCKARLQGNSTIKAVKFTDYLLPDHVGVEADQLPY